MAERSKKTKTRAHARLIRRCYSRAEHTTTARLDAHEDAVGICGVRAEGLARSESDFRVQRTSGCEHIHGAGLETHTLVILLGSERQNVIDDSPSYTEASCCLARVHRLELGVSLVQPAERADPEQHTISAGAEKRDRRVDEALAVERMHVPGRRYLPRKCHVTFQEGTHIVDTGIVDGDHDMGLHAATIQAD